MGWAGPVLLGSHSNYCFYEAVISRPLKGTIKMDNYYLIAFCVFAPGGLFWPRVEKAQVFLAQLGGVESKRPNLWSRISSTLKGGGDWALRAPSGLPPHLIFVLFLRHCDFLGDLRTRKAIAKIGPER